MYKSPAIKTFDSLFLLEQIGPMQTASVNIEFGATAYNTQTHSVIRYAGMEQEYKLARIYTKNELIKKG